jgi:hypothetical protein
MSFPNLVHPNAFKEGAPKSYNCQMLIEPSTVPDGFEIKLDGEGWEAVDIRHVFMAVAKHKWPDLDIKEAVKHGGLKWPLKDGDEIAGKREAEGKKGDVYEGMKVVNVKSSEEYPPLLYVVDKGKIVELDRGDESDLKRAEVLFRAGSYARVNANVKGVETPQGKFIVLYSNAVLFVKEGPRIGGMSGEDRFGGTDGGAAPYDPRMVAQADDEIPF